MARSEVPVYLFTGFLDAGKTTFIQETLEDPSFNDGENVLLLVCEEGEAEYQKTKFASSLVKIVNIEDEDDLTLQKLSDAEKAAKADKVVIEYNGMWSLDKLYNALPPTWTVYQEMSFADMGTYLVYNQNMRNLVYDKIKSCESIIFKHYNKDIDKMPYHKIVRAANRRCDIVYEYDNGKIELDNIEDPLPYDMNADVVVIEDKDYAIWYADMNDNEDNYYGKTVNFKGRILTGGGLKDNEFVIGRHIMTCCEADIQFGGLVAIMKGSALSLPHGGWATITATIEHEYSHMYENEGPVFHVIDLILCEEPEQPIATFY